MLRIMKAWLLMALFSACPGEQDSIYAVVEYWLDKHDRTGDRESLDRAVANAYYALLS